MYPMEPLAVQRAPGGAGAPLSPPVPGGGRPARADFTLLPIPEETPRAFGRRLAARLRDEDLTMVRLEVHGPLQAEAPFREGLEQGFGPVDWPLHWVEGQGESGGHLSGLHASALRGGTVHTLTLAGRPVARLFEDEHGRNLMIGGMGPADASAPRSMQAESLFENLEAMLRDVRMQPSHLLRTWFASRDILDWYGSFNLVRTHFFRRLGLHQLPASTAIGGRPPRGEALALAAWALDPGSGAPATPVDSPLQGAATEYGSAFSRATRVSSPGFLRLVVSGTASIDVQGYTVFPGRPKEQIERTLTVLEALLRKEGFGFEHVTRATAYHRTEAVAVCFRALRGPCGFPPLPVLLSPAVLCRDDLCFEMELDALRPSGEDPAARKETS